MREDPVAFMLNVGLHYRGTVSNQLLLLSSSLFLTLLVTIQFEQGWRGYKSYIGNKILYPGFSDRMKSLVLNSKKGTTDVLL